MKNLVTLKPIRKLMSTIGSAFLPNKDIKIEELPVIYIRPTINGRFSVWLGDRCDPDPRPNDEALDCESLLEAEGILPEYMEETRLYFGVMYLYIDRMHEKE